MVLIYKELVSHGVSNMFCIDERFARERKLLLNIEKYIVLHLIKSFLYFIMEE